MANTRENPNGNRSYSFIDYYLAKDLEGNRTKMDKCYSKLKTDTAYLAEVISSPDGRVEE